MRTVVSEFFRSIADLIPLPTPILEVGPSSIWSDRVTGIIPGLDCLTIDMDREARPDILANCMTMPIATGVIGTVVALDTFEHIKNPFKASEEIIRVLNPHGMCIVSTPYDLPIHRFPEDYFRPGPSGLDALFEPLPKRIVGSQGRPEFPHTVFMVGFRNIDVDVISVSTKLTSVLNGRTSKNPYRWLRFVPHFSKNPYVRSLTLSEFVVFEPRTDSNHSDIPI
jgi:SAM-dependent methyltransferase